MREVTDAEVCISGIGAITPFAFGWAEVYGLASSGVDVFDAWDASFDPPFAGAKLGLVRKFPKERYFNERQLRLMDRAMMISTTATGLAMEDAGLATTDQAESVATIFASMRGEMPSLYRFGLPLFDQSSSYNPALFPMIARNITCGQAALRFGLRGWSSMLASGEASGIHAMARGLELVEKKRAAFAIVCAYEVLSKLSLHHTAARWRKYGVDPASAAGALSTPTEGACVFVLEDRQRVEARGARPYAILKRVTHGYLHGDADAACQRAIDRHLSPGAEGLQPYELFGRDGRCDASVASRLEESMAASVRAGAEGTTPVVTRQRFGDGGSLSAMFQTAVLAQTLREQTLDATYLYDGSGAAARPDGRTDGIGSALLATVTDRRAYGLASLQRCA